MENIKKTKGGRQTTNAIKQKSVDTKIVALIHIFKYFFPVFSYETPLKLTQVDGQRQTQFGGGGREGGLSYGRKDRQMRRRPDPMCLRGHFLRVQDV